MFVAFKHFAHGKLFGFQAARVSINICICISDGTLIVSVGVLL